MLDLCFKQSFIFNSCTCKADFNSVPFVSSKCFLTQDNFASVEEVKVPTGLLAVCVDMDS